MCKRRDPSSERRLRATIEWWFQRHLYVRQRNWVIDLNEKMPGLLSQKARIG